MSKKLLAILLGAMMTASVFTACGNASDNGSTDAQTNDDTATTASAVEAVKAAGQLVVYTDAAFPPFEYVENNEVMGVDVDIAQAIADELGVTLKMENVSFDTIVPSIQGGKGDMAIAGMTINEERQKSVDFSESYITSVQYIIVPEDVSVSIMEDLAGMSIGVQKGTTSDFLVDEAINGTDEGPGVLDGSGASFTQYNNSIEAAQDLLTGRVDAVVADKLPAESIVASNSGLKCFELTYADGSVTDESYGIAFAKGSDLVEVANTVIAKLVEEGQIDQFVLNHTVQ